MDNFKVIYKILKFLEASMDYEEVDYSRISHEALGVSKPRWEQLLVLLAESSYIDRLTYGRDLSSGRPYIAEPIKPIITLKGLQYLDENSMMKQAAALAKGAIEMVGNIAKF